MELLAPAGSRESLVAAVEAGADAVYAGLQDFNARKKARNFTLHDIRVMADYLHRRGKKIYLTFNTLIKESEMASAFQLLNAIAALEVDALIVQDLGLAYMARKYFPHLELHGSTQMAVHNSAGVQFLEREGFSRVILARELSLKEMAAIRGAASMELEVFVHGALCYSLSGLCLASSFIGGHSGNRGLCTQPCRREVIRKNGKGFYFSTRDLEALSVLGRLREAGVKALKIEGRMKSAEYVSTVVSAYRRALDNPGEGLQALEECEDFSREKTAYYMTGRRGVIIEPGKPGVTGRTAATVEESTPGKLVIRLQRGLRPGDRLRTLNDADGEITTVNVRALYRDGCAVESAGSGEICEIPCEAPIKRGISLYIVGTAKGDEGRLKAAIEAIYRDYHRGRSKDAFYRGSRADAILRDLAAPMQGRAEKLPAKPMVRIDDMAWLDVMADQDFSEIIISSEALFGKDSTMGRLKPRIIAGLPLFIPQDRIEHAKASVLGLCRKGFRKWMADNPGHIEILSGSALEIVSGPFLYTLNTMAQRSLLRYNVKRWIASFEDDYLNIRDRGRKGAHSIVTLYSHPPCFITRAATDSHFEPHETVSSSGASFFIQRKGEITGIMSEKPVALFQYQEKLKSLSGGFLIDLSAMKPSESLWREVLRHFRDHSAMKGADRFNFKRGLK